MPVDDILMTAEEKMQKTEEVIVREFTGVRTGKASPGLVENLLVDVYGSQMRLREVASITTPESRTLAIQPWDVSTVGSIEKAIQKANLGLNPAVDGKLIRINLPELSEERRVEFTKIVKRMTEDGRVSVRHVRRDAMDVIKKETKTGIITEDEGSQGEKEIQKLTDKYIAKLDTQLEKKEKEIMTV
ncbi:MAG: ribosome recycling factor [Verrucomicrobia bacterium]|jgi:ribosome recycling factor|nr:ribosome recycling factor [Verrucomicrobiota bacterium]MBT4273738.1 ribosome recycling factor [Verrucomicrobiota bacterium]MBT5062935.1 ribosome recycling factor [Verrucomicrobiota bacterium]MBT5480183.1 ribosome recycling factor [Verrucomicrobiota bacterium]MBT6236911.1 ribosome recycling factor [Verrucomicrobiota bacterium]